MSVVMPTGRRMSARSDGMGRHEVTRMPPVMVPMFTVTAGRSSPAPDAVRNRSASGDRRRDRRGRLERHLLQVALRQSSAHAQQSMALTPRWTCAPWAGAPAASTSTHIRPFRRSGTTRGEPTSPQMLASPLAWATCSSSQPVPREPIFSSPARSARSRPDQASRCSPAARRRAASRPCRLHVAHAAAVELCPAAHRRAAVPSRQLLEQRKGIEMAVEDQASAWPAALRRPTRLTDARRRLDALRDLQAGSAQEGSATCATLVGVARRIGRRHGDQAARDVDQPFARVDAGWRARCGSMLAISGFCSRRSTSGSSWRAPEADQEVDDGDEGEGLERAEGGWRTAPCAAPCDPLTEITAPSEENLMSCTKLERAAAGSCGWPEAAIDALERLDRRQPEQRAPPRWLTGTLWMPER